MSIEGAPGGIQLAPLPPPPSDPLPTTPEASTTDPIPDTTAPLAPVITFPTASSFSTTTIIFSGTGEASSTLLVSWNEGPLSVVKVFPVSRRVPSIGIEGEDGSWSVSLLLPEGTTVVVFALRDDAGNLSESMAFTAAITLPTPLPIVRTALPGDILFSEISALPGREYVELYNQSDASIDLSGTDLLIPDVFHSIPLVGTVPPHGYWLISRAVIPGVVTDQVIDVPSWDDLGQSDLRLSNFLTIIDELPYCADWCGQVGPGFVIERFSFSLPTADYAKNWSMPIDHLTDSPGFGFGTPRMQNTLRYLLTLGSTLSESMTTSGATYLINNALTVEQGVTLTLSAGTTVEYVHGAQLIVAGGLVAEGTSIDPVILRGYSSDDPSLRGSVGLFVSGTITLTETDILNANSVVLAGASSAFDHVTMTQMSNGISVNEGSMRSNDLTLQDIDGPALLLSDTDATLSSTTITGAGWSGASSVVQVSGGSVEISDLSLAQCGPTVSNGISLYAASTTIDDLSLSECGTTVGIYISGYSKATITDATISSELGIGVMATGGADLVIASTTLSESAVGLHSNTAEVSGEGLTIVNNFSGVVDGGQSLLSIHQSTISGNNNGVTSAGPSSVVDMSNNYWGSPTGPTLPGQLPDTNGDAVSTGVVTDPYLTADPTLP
jgi:hypothetical protein